MFFQTLCTTRLHTNCASEDRWTRLARARWIPLELALSRVHLARLESHPVDSASSPWRVYHAYRSSRVRWTRRVHLAFLESARLEFTMSHTYIQEVRPTPPPLHSHPTLVSKQQVLPSLCLPSCVSGCGFGVEGVPIIAGALKEPTSLQSLDISRMPLSTSHIFSNGAHASENGHCNVVC